MCTHSRESEARLCPSNLNRRTVESVFLMARIIAWLPTRFGKPICLPFMSDKKLGRNNSLVVVVHRYLQHLSPTSAASDKRDEADLNKRMANSSYQALSPPPKRVWERGYVLLLDLPYPI